MENIYFPNLYNGYVIDIFIFTWDEFSTKTDGSWHTNRYNFYPTLNGKKLSDFDKNEIINLYKPKKIIFKEVHDINRKLIVQKDHKNGVDICFEGVVKLRKEYEKDNNIVYDYIIHTRMDILFLKKVDIDFFTNLYKTQYLFRQIGLPKKFIFAHMELCYKILDNRYPIDLDLFSIANFDIYKKNDLFYNNSNATIIFFDYKKDIDFKILREVDEMYLRDINLTQLPYKLGQVMVTNSKSLLGYIKMPFMLFFITYKHNKEEKIYQEKIKKDPSSKLQPLEFYIDYKEALKEKECFTYKLGEEFIKASKNWYGGGVYQIHIQRCA
ncbi:hypothetical protein KJ137_000596 [Campylobacter jejuni]|nr:hypothetical protein [Campylobacter jejuni]